MKQWDKWYQWDKNVGQMVPVGQGGGTVEQVVPLRQGGETVGQVVSVGQTEGQVVPVGQDGANGTSGTRVRQLVSGSRRRDKWYQ